LYDKSDTLGLSSCFILLGSRGESGLLLSGPPLPNYGKPLKPTVPTVGRNSIRGWANHSCMVISCVIQKTVIGNRVSKSVGLNYLTVKEQRVYGSYMGNYLPLLRCTLKGFERNYQIGILTNQINRQVRFNSYHVVQSSQTSLFESINPWFITGFVEGEGSFIINITKNNKTKTGWRVQVEFKIGLHKKDLNLLNGIQKFFGVGAVYNQAEDAVQLIVQSDKELIVIINHFDKYPPITKKKWGDFQLFKQVVYMMLNKEHLTIQGLDKIVSIKASLNLGLSAKLKTAFPSIIPATRNLDGRLICTIPDPFWIAGFTSAEGCFLAHVVNSTTHKLKKRIILVFSLSQHIREDELMSSLKNYFSCGHVYKNKEVFLFRVENFVYVESKLIPFFKEYPILGEKHLNFLDWCKIFELIKNKDHLNLEGLNKIQGIIGNMNRGRLY